MLCYAENNGILCAFTITTSNNDNNTNNNNNNNDNCINDNNRIMVFIGDTDRHK